jgi:hypothetical protein
MIDTAQDRNLLSVFDDTKRLVAKLMARENITVQILDGAPTAQFDPVTRTLILPNWPLKVEQIDTQIGHEVGHALFTDNSYLEVLAKKRRDKEQTSGLFTYINVIEDTRIERKMREAYPGLKRTFFEGRKSFAANGPIFQVAGPKHVMLDGKKVAVKTLRFIDRINIFYKIGAFVEVPFTAEEQAWLPIIDSANSTRYACEIAENLWKLAKEQQKDQKQEQPQQSKQKSKQQKSKSKQGEPSEQGEQSEDGEESEQGEEGEDGEPSEQGEQSEDNGQNGGSDDNEEGDGGDADDENDTDNDASGADGTDEDESADDAENGTSSDAPDDADGDDDASDGPDGVDEDPASETDQQMEKALRNLATATATPSIYNLLLQPVCDKDLKARTVTAQEWVKQCEAFLVAGRGTTATVIDLMLKEAEQSWNERHGRTAMHMAQEFERKRIARNMLRARTGKTGRLDMNKLASHQFSEDMFKAITTVPNGQSHGIVMLIDGSSSMNGVFANVLDQMMLFAKFAYHCHIPFQSFMFTDRIRGYASQTPVQTLKVGERGGLVGLMDTTDRRGFRRQMQMVLTLQSAFSHSKLSDLGLHGFPYRMLGGTPLFAGMMLVERHVERMKREKRLDKMTVFVLTDGDDTNGLLFDVNEADPTTGDIRRKEKHAHCAFVARDTVTKQTFAVATSVNGYNGRTYMQPANALYAMLFDVMKVRHNARTVAMYLSTDNTTEVSSAVSAVGKLWRGTSSYNHDAKTALVATKQFVLPEGVGVADLSVILLSEALYLQENTFAQLSTKRMKVTEIQAAFKQAAVASAANRVFVNAVMPHLI